MPLCLHADVAIRIEAFDTSGSLMKTTRIKSGTISLVMDENSPCPTFIVPTKPKPIHALLRPRQCKVYMSQLAEKGKAGVRLVKPNIQVLVSCPSCPEDLIRIFTSLRRISKGLRKPLRSLPGAPRTSPALKRRPTNSRGKENNFTGSKSSMEISRLTMGKKNSTKRKPEERDSNLKGGLELSDEQQMVVDAVEEGSSLFFTGSAGTGKSFLLKHVINMLPRHSTFITATTGIAAVHLHGNTLNSFAGIGDGSGNVVEMCRKVSRSKEAIKRWRVCKCLVIDEVSMLTAELFTKLEIIARHVRANQQPFGGIQLVLSGDFLQLPPVDSKRGESVKMCFESPAWSRCLATTIMLTKVYRQHDSEFVDILNEIRVGRVSESSIQRMERAVHESDRELKDGILPTTLMARRRDVDMVNNDQLSRLQGKPHIFNARDSGSDRDKMMLKKACPAKKRLVLKAGAQVMLIKNLDMFKQLTNGSRGVVEGFSDRSGSPIVRFSTGRVETIHPTTWTKSVNGLALASRRQLPLDLAWALSVHKSQGMTLDRVRVSLANVFEFGQAYVALSRARSFEGLWLTDFDFKCIKANPKVVKFYAHLESKLDLTQSRRSMPASQLHQ